MVEVGVRQGRAIGAFGVAVIAAAGIVVLSLPRTADAQEPSPIIDPAGRAPPPVEGKPAAGGGAWPQDVIADFHIESTVLGFDQGIGPAVGRDVAYNGKAYVVAGVFTADGQPCFSGGSRFTIAPAGGRLVIGLKTADPAPVSVASLK